MLCKDDQQGENRHGENHVGKQETLHLEYSSFSGFGLHGNSFIIGKEYNHLL